MATPIVQTSLFAFPDYDAYLDASAAENKNNVYTRGQNPTVEVLERKLAALEQGEACKAFGSGMAAVSAVILGLLSAGDHILFVNHTYGPTVKLAKHLKRLALTTRCSSISSPTRCAAHCGRIQRSSGSRIPAR